MAKGREAWILGVLLIAFVVVTVLFTQRSSEEEQKQQPSTYNARRNGTRALYDLFSRQGLKTERFERPLTDLPGDAGLLVIVEPVERPLQEAEGVALQKWLDEGGTLLQISQPLAEVEPSNLGWQEADTVPRPSVDGSADVAPKSPYARDVSELKVAGSAAVKINKPEKVQKLVSYGGEVYAVTWREKKGRVVYVSSAVPLSNEQLKLSALDNPVFFLNVAEEHARGARPIVLFDEYHHGFGQRKTVGKSFWAALGPGLRAATWYLLFGFLLLVYALNRRFGAVKELPTSQYRPSTEYIASMAALYQRSGAGILAVETILHDFLRDLSTRLDMEPTAAPELLAQAAHRRFGWDPDDLAFVLRRCGEVVAAPGPVTRPMEQEITQLAQRLQMYRKELSSQTAI